MKSDKNTSDKLNNNLPKIEWRQMSKKEWYREMCSNPFAQFFDRNVNEKE